MKKGSSNNLTASMDPDEIAAWDQVAACARQIEKAQLDGYLATMCIGSLPGGYFRPKTSDLDLVVLFKGPRPNQETYRSKVLELQALLAELPARYEIECLPRFIGDLAKSPSNGFYEFPDLVARLKLQSRLLSGSFDPTQYRIPNPDDFRYEFPRALNWFISQYGQPELAEPRSQLKYLFLVIRTWLAVCRNQLVYNKWEQMEAFEAAKPSQAISETLKSAAAAYLEGRPFPGEYADDLFALADSLKKEILSS